MLLLSKELRRLSKLYVKLIAKELPELRAEYMAEMILILASGKGYYNAKRFIHLHASG